MEPLFQTWVSRVLKAEGKSANKSLAEVLGSSTCLLMIVMMKVSASLTPACLVCKVKWIQALAGPGENVLFNNSLTLKRRCVTEVTQDEFRRV